MKTKPFLNGPCEKYINAVSHYNITENKKGIFNEPIDLKECEQYTVHQIVNINSVYWSLCAINEPD